MHSCLQRLQEADWRCMKARLAKWCTTSTCVHADVVEDGWDVLLNIVVDRPPPAWEKG